MLNSPLQRSAPWLDAVRGLGRRRGLLMLALALLSFLWGVAVAHRSLPYLWFLDDAHLVRRFTGPELAQAMQGNWDVDAIETPGYRPLTVLFNHARAYAFGESVVAHRLFMIALLAAYLAILQEVAHRLGTPPWQSALAGILTIAAKNNWWNLVWIADGVHAFTALLAILAALALISHLERPAPHKLPLSMLCAGLALLTREDALGMLASLPALGTAFVVVREGWSADAMQAARNLLEGKPKAALRRTSTSYQQLAPGLTTVGIYTVILVLVSAAFFAWRGMMIIPGSLPDPQFIGWADMVKWTLFPIGATFYPTIWTLVLGASLATALFRLSEEAQLRVFLWLTCAVITASPGMAVARPNLLLVPISFFSLYLATVAGEFGRCSRAAGVVSSVLVAATLVAATARNLEAQLCLHPQSSIFIDGTGQILWGDFANLGIPPARRDLLEAHLAQLGIHSAEDYSEVLPILVEEAERADRRRPDSGQDLFVPWISFMDP